MKDTKKSKGDKEMGEHGFTLFLVFMAKVHNEDRHGLKYTVDEAISDFQKAYEYIMKNGKANYESAAAQSAQSGS